MRTLFSSNAKDTWTARASAALAAPHRSAVVVVLVARHSKAGVVARTTM
jgi:hypothetical protein